MVNAGATKVDERRGRDRAPASHASGLGAAKLNPFGDLHTLQHLSARLARGLRNVFEPLLRQEVRAWAEPLVVQRFADYRGERADALTAWLPLAMSENPVMPKVARTPGTSLAWSTSRRTAASVRPSDAASGIWRFTNR